MNIKIKNKIKDFKPGDIIYSPCGRNCLYAVIFEFPNYFDKDGSFNTVAFAEGDSINDWKKFNTSNINNFKNRELRLASELEISAFEYCVAKNTEIYCPFCHCDVEIDSTLSKPVKILENNIETVEEDDNVYKRFMETHSKLVSQEWAAFRHSPLPKKIVYGKDISLILIADTAIYKDICPACGHKIQYEKSINGRYFFVINDSTSDEGSDYIEIKDLKPDLS